ncbi:FABP family protein [Pseudoclavibacter sp. CFCC 13796]|uniref:FABP family protein n=1 Tax=Pseudoclavibacter sp. CFCC 13796 TaxID=2615179 RepID=UPI0013014ECE|nr:FABP family protein [Pseudoclavibacter sp. CFCC 13796]KAB1660523.1 FABP family protein [Pseudoclavibacter sp. CFCC 13796]
MFDIPEGLPAEVNPLSWLIGVWEGTGVVSYGVDEDHVEYEFGQRVSFTNEGLADLHYNSYYWLLDDERTPLTTETGYWRLAAPERPADHGPALLPGADGAARTIDDVDELRSETGFPLEVSVLHPDGISELYVGTINGPRVQIGTDAVLRPAESRLYTAAERMYGLVDGQLMWAWDIAAFGRPMASMASGVLARRSVSGADAGVAE